MFSDNLMMLCTENNIAPSNLAVKLGYSTTAGNKWATGTTPRQTTLNKIAAYFGISVDDLIADKTIVSINKKTAPSISDEAVRIAKQYDELDIYGKKAVKSILAVENERMSAESDKTEPDSIEMIPHYFTAAAAGYAAPIDGEDYELIPRDVNVPKKADYCIEIAGDSMEPYIKDKQRIYVQKTADIPEFSPCVWFVDGDVYVKQFCTDHRGTLYLLSANPKREDANITISRDSGRTAICLGKVLLSRKLPEPVYI